MLALISSAPAYSQSNKENALKRAIERAKRTKGTQTVTPVYDSSEIKSVAPSKTAEEKVFSDKRMNDYKEKTSYKNFLDRFLEWLAELFFDKTGPENILAARNIFIWTIIIVSVIVILLLFFRSEVGGLVRPKTVSTAFSFSDVTEDISGIDFGRRISDALGTNDYRLAIRWHYLKILFLLDKNRIINFVPFKTNIDYGNEIRNFENNIGTTGAKGKNLYVTFRELSRVYEFVWYGKFDIDKNDYSKHAEEFLRFENQINV
jgi:preprotein translocase subunit SecG